MPHMMVYLLKQKRNCKNVPRYFPNFGTVGTVNLTGDVYTNDGYHGLCFPIVFFVFFYFDSGHNDNCSSCNVTSKTLKNGKKKKKKYDALDTDLRK